MTYSRINGVEKVVNDNGTMMFYKKGGNRHKQSHPQHNSQHAADTFNRVLESKRCQVEIPVFPMPDKQTLLVDADGNTKIVAKVPVGARFVGASSQFNIYEY